LNWIKFQNQRITISESVIMIHELVDGVLEQMHEIALNRDNEVLNLIPAGEIVKTDRNILTIILQNLLSNAHKFTFNSIISITSLREGAWYKIRVRDEGEGMSADELRRLHDVIERKIVTATQPNGNGKGNGLGYIIISELLELINGSISVESQLGKGTTVIIGLPAYS